MNNNDLSGRIYENIVSIFNDNNLVINSSKNSINYSDDTGEYFIYELLNDDCIVSLFYIDGENHFNLYNGIKSVRCNKNDFYSFVHINKKSVELSYSYILNEYFNKLDGFFNRIYVSDSFDKYEIDDGELRINRQLILNIFDDVSEISKKSMSYKTSVKTYLINKSLANRSIKNVKKKTLINKGEVEFFVDRINLDSKRTKKDYLDHLNDADIRKLQDMIRKMIYDDVFEKKFIEVLDDYFVRKKLEDIILTGKKILALKSSNMYTDAIKCIKQKNAFLKDAKILEELWQKYFEKNLLHLLFSYQKLYPKIELNIKNDGKIYSKKPDFIGINHYGGIDIIEIKHHLTPILTYDSSHKNFVISSDLSKAIMQATNYIDALIENKFTNENISNEIKQNILSGNLSRPTAIIIISSKDHWVKNQSKYKGMEDLMIRDFTRIRNSLCNISILTFDEILAIADRYKNNIVIK